ncbi:MAG: DUF4838 domain-containing protein [Phycisphaeraceae bacterium]|nr:DUF4838 domain-containing protein [Phycisphaeraceae bacterium]
MRKKRQALLATSTCCWMIGFALCTQACANQTKTSTSSNYVLASNNQTSYQIVIGNDASTMVRHAAKELASILKQSTGATFKITNVTDAKKGTSQIAVGPGAAKNLQPTIDLSYQKFGDEGILIRTTKGHLILTGGKKERRGTVYAVTTFLSDYLGLRWWSAQEKRLPKHPALTLPAINRFYQPPLEYREVHTSQSFNSDWSLYNRCNGQDSKIPNELGGRTRYVGPYFAHTANLLVNPAEHFKEHPQWFSQINGKRVAPPAKSQWCLTNKELLIHVIELSKNILRKEAGQDKVILSISQNDWPRRCLCDQCAAVEAEEGSPSGVSLRFVNAVGQAVEDEFPNALIDMLAYRYTRLPPRVTKARPNVIVRLTTYEASFSAPLNSPQNQAFADSIKGWSKICKRIYIWDYIVNFRYYVHPHPNFHVLGPNIHFFMKHNVRGIFSQANRHKSPGDFKILRGWVMAQLLWDPSLDAQTVIAQFVNEYYGAGASGVAQYLDLLHTAVAKTDHHMGISDNALAPYLTPGLLYQSDQILCKTIEAIKDDPISRHRVEMVRASVLHAIINGWAIRQQIADMRQDTWPFTVDLQSYTDDFVRIINEQGITRLSEGGREGDIPKWTQKLVTQGKPVQPFEGLKQIPRDQWFVLPEHSFTLHGVKAGHVARVDDPLASNGRAARMPANHKNWSTQMEMIDLPITLKADEQWEAYAVVRVEPGNQAFGDSEPAFKMGIYSPATLSHLVHGKVIQASQIKDSNYQLYRIGPTKLGSPTYAWVAPMNQSVKRRAIYIDQIVLMKKPR